MEQTTELRRVQLQLTENIDFLANLANQQGRRGGKLKVSLPPRFLRSASAALAETAAATTAAADAAVAAEAMAAPARWTAYVSAASSVPLSNAGAIRHLLESAIEELREYSADDAQQGALIAQLERALSSAVFDDAAAGGAQKMASAIARDWQSASFPGEYTQFELPPRADRLKRRAPPFTTVMQGLSYRRAARVRTSDRDRKRRLKVARTDGGDLTFVLPPPAPPVQPPPAPRAAPVPAAAAARAAAAPAAPASPAVAVAVSGHAGVAATSFESRRMSPESAAFAVAAVAAVACSEIPEDSDEMDEDYRLGVPPGMLE